MKTTTALQKKILLSFKISLLLYISLIITQLTKVWWFNPPQGSRALISFVVVAPLLFPVVGFLQKESRAASWLCFILCFYFISGVSGAWSNPGQINSWLILVCSSLLFISNMMFIRWQGETTIPKL